LQIIHNLLEQEPGADLLAAARETGAAVIVRVPHSSGLLEGHFTAETTFPAGDHRRHRSREWLIEGVQKVERLRFLERGGARTLGQAALQWLLAEPLIVSVLPNIYDAAQLAEFAAAADAPPLSADELTQCEALYRAGFGLAAVAV